jgi:hypothetical protein
MTATIVQPPHGAQRKIGHGHTRSYAPTEVPLGDNGRITPLP